MGGCVQTLKIPLLFLTVPNTARHYSISVIVNFFVSVSETILQLMLAGMAYSILFCVRLGRARKLKTFWPLFVFYGSVWSVIGGR